MYQAVLLPENTFRQIENSYWPISDELNKFKSIVS